MFDVLFIHDIAAGFIGGCKLARVNRIFMTRASKEMQGEIREIILNSLVLWRR